MQVWSKRKIIAEIQQLEQRNSNHVQQHHSGLWKAGVRYFGSWEKAIEAAGFDYSLIRRWGPRKSVNAGSRGKCQTEGCEQPHHARGYCQNCYNRFRYHKDEKVSESVTRKFRPEKPAYH